MVLDVYLPPRPLCIVGECAYVFAAGCKLPFAL